MMYLKRIKKKKKNKLKHVTRWIIIIDEQIIEKNKIACKSVLTINSIRGITCNSLLIHINAVICKKKLIKFQCPLCSSTPL